MAMTAIKGLTVKIGGDTTELGKALDSIDKKSKNLSSELGEINRMLRLDPGNADLLAQKQQVLADAVANTTARLETLREAEAQVQEQFERGEVSADQVRALQREIMATERRLTGYQRAVQETADEVAHLGESADDAAPQVDELTERIERLGESGKTIAGELKEIDKALKLNPGNLDLIIQRHEVLAEAVDNTRDRLTGLQEQERRVQEQFQRGEATEAQLRAIQREVIETTRQLQDYERSAAETEETLRRMAEGSPDDEIEETGDEAQRTSRKLDDLADSADDAGDAGEGMGSKLAGAAKAGLSAVAAAATAVVGAMVGAVESTREYRTEMGKLDTAFTTMGHSSEAAYSTYSALQGILGETDQAVEAANHLAKLTDNEQDLASWTDICTGVYATFGASLPIEGLTEAANETAKTGALTGALADALNWAGVSEDDFQASLDACSTEQERQALITETLTGLYSEAADAYKETNAEIIRANEANELWTASMAEIGAVTEPVVTDVKMLGASLLSDLVPGVVAATESLRGLFNGDAGAADGLGTALSGIISQLLGKVTEMVPALAEVAVSLITGLVTTFADMTPQIMRAATDVVMVLIEGLTAAGPSVLSAVLDMAYFITDALIMAAPQLLTAAVQFFTAIAEALPGIVGDLVDQIDTLVIDLCYGLVDSMPALLTAAVQFFQALLDAVPQIVESLAVLIPSIVQSVADFLTQGTPLLIEAAITLLGVIIDAIPVVIASLLEVLPSLVQSVVGLLVQATPALLEGAVQMFSAVLQAVPLLIDSLLPMIPEIVATIATILVENFPVLLGYAVELFMQLVYAIPQIYGELARALDDIGASLAAWFGDLADAFSDWLMDVIPPVQTWAADMVKRAKKMATDFVAGVAQFLQQLPGKAATVFNNVIQKVTTWAANMISKARTAASNTVNTVAQFLQNLPGRVYSAISGAIQRVAQWGTSMVAKAKTAASNVVSAVTNGLKNLPGKITSIGGDLVTGLWNGIGNKVQWLKNKISGFASSVLDSIKGFFGVHSPSTETAWIGEMLDEGLAGGVLDNAAKPVAAMRTLSGDMLGAASGELDGLAIERSLRGTARAAAAVPGVDNGLMAKLDKVLDLLERGQVLTIDGKALVGATVDAIDGALGQRRALAARGAV